MSDSAFVGEQRHSSESQQQPDQTDQNVSDLIADDPSVVQVGKVTNQPSYAQVVSTQTPADEEDHENDAIDASLPYDVNNDSKLGKC